MKYEVGQKLMWFRDNNYEPAMQVEVEEVRSRGAAKLSNGWVVDSEGIAEGNAKVRGGTVFEITDARSN